MNMIIFDFFNSTYSHVPPCTLHKYKCLWGVGGKGQNSSLQEGTLHTFTLRLGYSRISILYKKIKKKFHFTRQTISIETGSKPFHPVKIHCKKYIKIKTHNTPLYKTCLTYHIVLRDRAISPLKNIGLLLWNELFLGKS